MPFPDNEWITRHVAEARRVYGHGGYFEIMAFRINEIGAFARFMPISFPHDCALSVRCMDVARWFVSTRSPACL